MKNCPNCGELIGDNVDQCFNCHYDFVNPDNNRSLAPTDYLDFILTTTNSIEGYKVLQYIDLVYGTSIYLVGGLIGGGLVSQEKLFGSAISEAKNHITEKAKRLGADAVIGIKQSFTSPGGINDMILVLTGTAVKLQKI